MSGRRQRPKSGSPFARSGIRQEFRPPEQTAQEVADEFDNFARAESARWGDAYQSPAYRYDDSAINGQSGDWVANIAYRVNIWIPERRTHSLLP